MADPLPTKITSAASVGEKAGRPQERVSGHKRQSEEAAESVASARSKAKAKAQARLGVPLPASPPRSVEQELEAEEEQSQYNLIREMSLVLTNAVPPYTVAVPRADKSDLVLWNSQRSTMHLRRLQASLDQTAAYFHSRWQWKPMLESLGLPKIVKVYTHHPATSVAQLATHMLNSFRSYLLQQRVPAPAASGRNLDQANYETVFISEGVVAAIRAACVGSPEPFPLLVFGQKQIGRVRCYQADSP